MHVSVNIADDATEAKELQKGSCFDFVKLLIIGEYKLWYNVGMQKVRLPESWENIQTSVSVNRANGARGKGNVAIVLITVQLLITGGDQLSQKRAEIPI